MKLCADCKHVRGFGIDSSCALTIDPATSEMRLCIMLRGIDGPCGNEAKWFERRHAPRWFLALGRAFGLS